MEELQVKMQKSKFFIGITLILVLQISLTVFYGIKKSGYHLDEMYTYTLANYEGGFVTDTEEVIEGWKSGEFYKEALSVENEESFNYRIPYNNQKEDVHPPLYYFVIHTFSSLATGQYSKWIGIIPNIIFNCLSTLVLFWISRKMCKNTTVALICTVSWALSNGGIESGVFTRMYAMLTFFVISLVGLHIKVYDDLEAIDDISVPAMIMLMICTVAGVLTQYYYMIFCFFLCGAFCVYLVSKKKWKVLCKYIATEFGALIISIICFPTMLVHIFSGYRGEEAFEAIAETDGFCVILKTVAAIINGDLFNGFLEEILWSVVLIVLFLIGRIYLLKRERFAYNRLLQIVMLGMVGVFYVIIVAKIAPFQTNRYYMCVYPILILSVLLGLYELLKLTGMINNHVIVAAFTLFLVITVFNCNTKDVEYVNSDCTLRVEQLKQYEGYPAIVLNGIYDAAADSYLYEYGNYSAVYRCAEEYDLSGLTNAAETYDIADGFLLYAYGINDDEDVLLEKLREHIPIDQFKLVTDIRCRVYFCTLANNE